MKWRSLLVGVLVIFVLMSWGCAGMNDYSGGKGGMPTADECNGDVPSPFPPYCRPVHN